MDLVRDWELTSWFMTELPTAISAHELNETGFNFYSPQAFD